MRGALEQLHIQNQTEGSARVACERYLRSFTKFSPLDYNPSLNTSKTYAFLDSFGFGDVYEGVLRSRVRRRGLDGLREQASDFLAAAELPLPEYVKWREDHYWCGRVYDLDRKLESQQPALVLEDLKRREAQFRATLIGHEVLFALELYRRTQGSYPHDLKELSPEYLPKETIDAVRGKPFHYLSVGDTFLLGRGNPYSPEDETSGRALHAPRIGQDAGRFLPATGWKVLGAVDGANREAGRNAIKAWSAGEEVPIPSTDYQASVDAPEGVLEPMRYAGEAEEGDLYLCRKLEVRRDTKACFLIAPPAGHFELFVGGQEVHGLTPWARMSMPMSLKKGVVPLIIRCWFDEHVRPMRGPRVGTYADPESLRLD